MQPISVRLPALLLLIHTWAARKQNAITMMWKRPSLKLLHQSFNRLWYRATGLVMYGAHDAHTERQYYKDCIYAVYIQKVLLHG